MQSRPQQYEALQQKAKVLYTAHLARANRVQQEHQVNDSSFAALQTSLSMSRDIHIEGIIDPASPATRNASLERRDHRAQLDSLLENGGALSDTAAPIAPARPTNDRPKTFD